MNRLASVAIVLALELGPLRAASVPRTSPDFTIDLVGGKQLKLSDFKGKVVVLEFLFTTCPHCQRSSQMMTRLYSELGAKGFQPIGIAINPMAQMLVSDFIRDFKVSFPLGYSNQDAALGYLGISAVQRWVVPQIVLIDRKGVIRAQTPALGDEKLQDETNLRQQVEALLKEGAPASVKKHAAAKKTGS